jgi:hypothetical protein
MFETNEHNFMIINSGPDKYPIECNDQILEDIWTNEYETWKIEWRSNLINCQAKSQHDGLKPFSPSSITMQTMQLALTDDIDVSRDINMASYIDHPHDQIIQNDVEHLNSIITKFTLNTEQTHAFSMIAQHSLTDKPSQLRMFLGGAGGTGKSQVINALHTFFETKGQERRF